MPHPPALKEAFPLNSYTILQTNSLAEEFPVKLAMGQQQGDAVERPGCGLVQSYLKIMGKSRSIGWIASNDDTLS